MIAQRLAAAGRHEHQRIAAGNDVVDDLGLPAPEGGVAEDGLENVLGSGQDPPIFAEAPPTRPRGVTRTEEGVMDVLPEDVIPGSTRDPVPRGQGAQGWIAG